MGSAAVGSATPGRASVNPDAGTARPMGAAATGRAVATPGPVSPSGAEPASGRGETASSWGDAAGSRGDAASSWGEPASGRDDTATSRGDAAGGRDETASGWDDAAGGRGGAAGGRSEAASGRGVAGTRAGAPAVPADGFEDGEPRARQDTPDGSDGDAEDPDGGLRSASAELRRKLRTQRQLRLVTLMSLAALVLLVLPAFFAVRATVSDPVFASLDSLDVPTWASSNKKDFESNSALCLLECSFRERAADSAQPFAETTDVYAKALTKAGWTQRQVEGCPESPIRADEGTYSCWSRDELTLDLAVGLPGCAVDRVAAELNPPVGVEAPLAADPATCEGSTVNIKVWNAIADQRGKKDTAPGPVGVQPDRVLRTDDPVFQQSRPTPEAS